MDKSLVEFTLIFEDGDLLRAEAVVQRPLYDSEGVQVSTEEKRVTLMPSEIPPAVLSAIAQYEGAVRDAAAAKISGA